MTDQYEHFRAAIIVSDRGLEATGVTFGNHKLGARLLAEADTEIHEFAALIKRKARNLSRERKSPSPARGQGGAQ